MNCPRCGSTNVYTLDSRDGKHGRIRRRRCADCDSRWTTVEIGAEEYERLKRLRDAIAEAIKEGGTDD